MEHNKFNHALCTMLKLLNTEKYLGLNRILAYDILGVKLTDA